MCVWRMIRRLSRAHLFTSNSTLNVKGGYFIHENHFLLALLLLGSTLCRNESSLLRWKYLAQYWSEKVLSRHNSELSSLHCNYLEEKEKIWSISFNSFESFDFNFAHAHVSFEEYMMKPQDDLFKRLSPSASFIACNTKVFDIQRPRREYT